MAANIVNLFNDERSLRLRADVIQDLGDGWEVAAGEDVLIDETRAVSKLANSGSFSHYLLFRLRICLMAPFGHCNTLKHGDASIRLE